MSDMSVADAARRLAVHESRVRALLASGELAGRRIGSVWVVEGDSVERRRETDAGVAVRPFSPRMAWAAGALLDDLPTPWLTTGDRARLRTRLRRDVDTKTVRRWLKSRAVPTRYRVADGDIPELTSRPDVVTGGISAADAFGLGLGHSGEAEVYADTATTRLLQDEFFLIESAQGNLTLRSVQGQRPWHLMSARTSGGRHVAPRLIVAVDLLDADDNRSRRAGSELLTRALRGGSGDI